MCASGFELAFDEAIVFTFHRCTAERFTRLVMRNCVFATEYDDRHFGALFRMPPHHVFNRARAAHLPVYEREVFTRRSARLQLPNELGLRLGRFRHHHDAARVFVEPMHDACAHHTCERGRVMQQRIQQGAVAITRARMHDKAWWLVDHEQMLVLENDFQRNVFGQRFRVNFVGREIGF
jgi:hypothetical protein